jgi:hypothetical protein
MAASCARASADHEPEGHAVAVADYFCRNAKLRVKELFRSLHDNEDRCGYRLAQKLLTEMPASLQAEPIHHIASIPSPEGIAQSSAHREAA